MTYMAGFTVIRVKGHTHSDQLGSGLAASPIGHKKPPPKKTTTICCYSPFKPTVVPTAVAIYGSHCFKAKFSKCH